MPDSTLPDRRFRHSFVRVALYARVSTANNGQDPVLPTRELREYCERRDGSLWANTLTWGYQVPKRNAPNLIA